ncbi:MAG TPA: hypothetical protein VHO48_01800 [Anaerolineaceae bacterium]|nr:hypothetical protein [Anaerolineaceae bacterium]
MKDPSEEKITSALEHYAPQPSRRFYRQIDQSPWKKPGAKMAVISIRQIASGVAAGVLLMLALGLSIPTVRASFFSFLGLGVSPAETVPNPPVPAESIVDRQKVDEIAPLAGWEIKTPTWAPEGYAYHDALYDATNHLVLLTFFATRTLPGGDPNMTQTKVITLVQAERNDIVPLMVAPSTNVDDISVLGQPAAYATGAWEGDAVSGLSTWNASYELKNVYWQMGTVYVNLNTDDAQVSKEDLIQMANSVK